ncbi:D-alanyl-D-alanine dipeptidase [Jeongeupia sp. HS-3]|nr:D-alanyl-D-alanine dipeptidase [Jeongeupia sp. HS-3]
MSTGPSLFSATKPLIRECGDPLVDIRKGTALRYGPPPECPETAHHYCLLRRDVYQRLLRVQQSLPQGYYLRLYEGLRSLTVQALLFEQEHARACSRMPHAPASETHASAARLVAPVTHFDGSMNIPPHSTGGAVDVEIVDESGKVIDFAMEICDWANVDPKLCDPMCPDISDEAASNRRLLAEAMTQEEFASYSHEWWHFSYGDPHWATFTGNTHAIYGPCTETMIIAAKHTAI